MLSHLPSWTFMKAPNSSGVLENPSKPTLLNLAPGVRAVDDLAQRAVESRHDGRGPSGSPDKARPSIKIEAFYSGFVHGRQVRIQ
jgi:hypothetical protein